MRKRGASFRLRLAVFARDGGICAWCAADCEKIKRVFHLIVDFEAQGVYAGALNIDDDFRSFWDADHIIAVADGGGDELENLQTLCVDCHKVKTRGWIEERAERRADFVLIGAIMGDFGVFQETPDRKLEREALARRCEERNAHVDSVIDFVNGYIEGQIRQNGDWPKTLEPIESDYYADPWIYH